MVPVPISFTCNSSEKQYVMMGLKELIGKQVNGTCGKMGKIKKQPKVHKKPGLKKPRKAWAF